MDGEGAEEGFGCAGGANGVGASGVDVGDVAGTEEGEDRKSGFWGVELGLGGPCAEGGGAEDYEGVG